MEHKVFVYGTLKYGKSNHKLLSTSELVGQAETEPAFNMFALGYFPGCAIGGNTKIKGEVYKVNDEVLKKLDWLEGHPNHFKRIEVKTSLGEAWMYTVDDLRYTVLDFPLIASGEWK